MKTIDLTAVADNPSDALALQMIIAGLLKERPGLGFTIPGMDLWDLGGKSPEERMAALCSEGLQIVVHVGERTPGTPSVTSPTEETSLQEFVRLFNEARGELDDHDMLDLPAINDPAKVAEITNRANKAVADLHAFLAKHPVGSIKLP